MEKEARAVPKRKRKKIQPPQKKSLWAKLRSKRARKPMDPARRWCLSFGLCLLLAVLLIPALNLLTDPLGAFGDPIFHWDSYNFTQNPRLAKVPWIEEHFDDYDSYVVGPSSTSSLPKEDLEKTFGGSFYNMMSYGANWYDIENTCNFLLDRDEVRTLVINAFFSTARVYGKTETSLNYASHPDVDGSNRLLFTLRFLFASPRYAMDKLAALRQDTYLQQSFDVFDVESGAYDKRVRDVEPIGSLEEYLEAYPVFKDYPEQTIRLEAVEEAVAALGRIRDRCAAAGTRLVVICVPGYWENILQYAPEDVHAYLSGLVSVTELWDFSLSSASYEPRYFYDATHFRNDLGRMLLARIAEDETVWYPEDLGTLVNAENLEEHWAGFYDAAAEDLTESLTVLMYHDLIEREGDSGSDVAMTVHQFAQEMVYLQKNGYHTVTLDELKAFVEQGTPLPEKPVLITFDDGYLSNYVYAYPILEELGQHAVIFAIGATMGQTEHYKDTEYPITPHFSYEQAAEMVAAGCVSVQSHTYDMHQWEPYESGGTIHETILRAEGESEEDYIALLRTDYQTSRELLEEGTGERQYALAFPGGQYDTLSQAILREEGVELTFSTRTGEAVLVRGLRQSLCAIKRNNVARGLSLDEFAALLGEEN
ncbi:MAG: polysaccharide deacetylase family protein [Oscillospiraceae bacterium]|nr:polysaccharide deacetylase family protein [Oscillospiraceae bacterium]